VAPAVGTLPRPLATGWTPDLLKKRKKLAGGEKKLDERQFDWQNEWRG
jgi:hypothetical protein